MFFFSRTFSLYQKTKVILAFIKRILLIISIKNAPFNIDWIRLNYATTNHQPPTTTIHHNQPPAKIYPLPPTTIHHQPKYVHHHSLPPTNSQNVSTTTHHSLKYIQVRRCFIRKILTFFIQK